MVLSQAAITTYFYAVIWQLKRAFTPILISFPGGYISLMEYIQLSISLEQYIPATSPIFPFFLNRLVPKYSFFFSRYSLALSPLHNFFIYTQDPSPNTSFTSDFITSRCLRFLLEFLSHPNPSFSLWSYFWRLL